MIGRNRWFGIQRSAENWRLFRREAKLASDWIKNPLTMNEKNSCTKTLLEMNEKELVEYFKKKSI